MEKLLTLLVHHGEQKVHLDAAELMNIGWNYRREHLHPDQRSHSIFLESGDQPNVVPSKASIWFFLREITYEWDYEFV